MIEQLTKVATVGSEWVLWLLFALSVTSISAIVERWFFFQRRRIDLNTFGKELVSKLRQGDRAALLTLTEQHPSTEAAVLRSCLDWLDDGPDALREALDAALGERRAQLEQGSVLLGTVGNNAPFLGLLGTVLGVVQAFQELEKSAGAAMGSVMGGIAEALVATAVGILVALPAVIAFNVFGKKASRVEDNARTLLSLVLAHQKSTQRPRATEGG